MGNRLVGAIERWEEPTVPYRIHLPIHGAVPEWRCAHSLLAARRQLLQWLCGWFVEAGIAFEAIHLALAEQALRETESEIVSREAVRAERPDSVNLLSSDSKAPL